MRKSALLFVPFVLFSLLVIACKGSNNGEDGNGLLVRIGGHTLSKEDLAEVMAEQFVGGRQCRVRRTLYQAVD